MLKLKLKLKLTLAAMGVLVMKHRVHAGGPSNVLTLNRIYNQGAKTKTSSAGNKGTVTKTNAAPFGDDLDIFEDWQAPDPYVLKFPSTRKEYEDVAAEFEKTYNTPLAEHQSFSHYAPWLNAVGFNVKDYPTPEELVVHPIAEKVDEDGAIRTYLDQQKTATDVRDSLKHLEDEHGFEDQFADVMASYVDALYAARGTHYEGGQFMPGGARAPQGGAWLDAHV
jgi:hypothetical protein